MISFSKLGVGRARHNLSGDASNSRQRTDGRTRLCPSIVPSGIDMSDEGILDAQFIRLVSVEQLHNRVSSIHRPTLQAG